MALRLCNIVMGLSGDDIRKNGWRHADLPLSSRHIFVHVPERVYSGHAVAGAFPAIPRTSSFTW